MSRHAGVRLLPNAVHVQLLKLHKRRQGVRLELLTRSQPVHAIFREERGASLTHHSFLLVWGAAPAAPLLPTRVLASAGVWLRLKAGAPRRAVHKPPTDPRACPPVRPPAASPPPEGQRPPGKDSDHRWRTATTVEGRRPPGRWATAAKGNRGLLDLVRQKHQNDADRF